MSYRQILFAKGLSEKYGGTAICNGMEEKLKPGVMHICPRDSEHSIISAGKEDLSMRTIVVKKHGL
ncbi:MAG: hypothetical protein IJ088_07695 [Clostridia bacterium]|nr:hypothetical protein [Clostridia bacterium]